MKAFSIASNTFREGVRQPFYLLVLVFVLVMIVLHFWLPFFTLGAGDLLMYKDVCLGYMLFGLLVMALLLASKVVDEEIESRTMLTLMSKPVRRWELIVGKFAGVLGAVTLALIVFAAVLMLMTWLRVPTELRIDPDTVSERQFEELAVARHMHVMSLLPAYVVMWLQIAVMASIAVALSTRLGMVVNLVVGIGVFLVSHLTPFLAQGLDSMPAWQRWLARVVVIVLPNLEDFNINEIVIYKTLVFGVPAAGPNEVAYVDIWSLVGSSALYAAAYVSVALLLALAMFRTRELG